MHKLKLRLDDLRVDTFSITPPQKAKGTVFGEQCTCWTHCPTCEATCPETCEVTCEQSCRGTCFATCDFDCALSESGYSCATSPYPIQPCFPCN